MARCDGIDIQYDIESLDEPANVAALLRTSRNGCFVRQTMARPDLIHDTNLLNGKPLNLDDYPPPAKSN